jgi:hypothetical protein
MREAKAKHYTLNIRYQVDLYKLNISNLAMENLIKNIYIRHWLENEIYLVK